MNNSSPLNRRVLLTGGLAALMTGTALAGAAFAATEDAFANSPFRKVTDAGWRKRLSKASYDVLRNEGTEYPGSSPLLKEHRKGVFVCLGCNLPLFNSDTKFESGTGWPSFFRAIDANIGKKTDRKLGYVRTEYHCARCLGHQGHVFDDGPPPTGLRYCNNGAALKFLRA
jgi:peptide-methionine (R)-S-oxide reductase